MTLGILGGMSWASTLEYYRLLNESIQATRGKQHSADLLVASVDFQKIIEFQVRNQWDEAGQFLRLRAESLEQSGAKALLIASNTMHRVVDHVTSGLSIPVLNIFDAVAASLQTRGIKRAGLLGTRYTMNDPFFREEYRKRGIVIVVPDSADAAAINGIIFRELIHGTTTETSRVAVKNIAERLTQKGADGIILGCTELPLLFSTIEKSSKSFSQAMFFDTTELHVAMALKWFADQPN